MNIFTPEYIILAVVLLIAVIRILKSLLGGMDSQEKRGDPIPTSRKTGKQ